MRKVTTINLNGRAYQLEEQGFEKLQTYLKQAEASLAKNPDKDEVMADIEQAVADKCDRILKDGKNVVTTEQVAEIVEQMGAVEDETASPKGADAKEESVPKRLFIIQQGSMLTGVCSGIGAYFGLDPNLVRLAFVLLTIFTGGFWILVYLALALFLPTAKTDRDFAEAYGKPMTAQGIVARAKERGPNAESMQQLSTVFMQILRILARLISIGSAIIFGVLTAGWLWTLWQIVLGRAHFNDQLQSLNGWREWVIVTAIYLLASLPLLLVARLFNRVAVNRNQTRISTISESSLAVLWGVAVITLIGFGTAYVPNVRDYVNSHSGHINVGNSSICANHDICGPEPVYRYKTIPMPVGPPIPGFNQ